jgi:hypothetical protein
MPPSLSLSVTTGAASTVYDDIPKLTFPAGATCYMPGCNKDLAKIALTVGAQPSGNTTLVYNCCKSTVQATKKLGNILSGVEEVARKSFLAEVTNVREIKSAKAVARDAAKAVARPAGE